MKKILLSLMAVFACVSMHADEWSINFAEIGDANGLADKAGASIGAAVDNGMGNVTLGEPLNTNFGIQTGTSWIYRTAQKALYQSNSGPRNFGVFNAKKKQVITLEISAAPTPTNATLKSTNGNVRTYEVTADGTVSFNLARYNYIYSIAVSNPSSSEVEYTVKYVDAAGKELKESTKNSGEPGAAIVVGEVEKASFVAEGMKYIYVSDDSEGKTIAADGSSVVTLVFRQAASYVVNAKFNGNVISTANVFEGDNAYVYAPYYQFVDGKLYNTPAVDKGTLSYGQVTLSNVTADADINVTYTEDATQNAVFYAEGEDIATCKPVKDGYTETRMSNGAAGYANNSVITTLEPGVYTLTTSSRVGTTNFTVNGVNVHTLTSTGSVVTETSAEFTVKGTSELIATCDKTTSYFDYVLIRKVGEAPKNTIAAGKYTLTADVALAEGVTEEIVPADFKKYVGTYKSNATLAGDENSLTIAENDENGLFAGFEIQGDAVVLSAGKTITLNGKVFNVRTAADAENGSLAITAEGDNYKMDAANVWYNGKKVATITNIVIAKAAAPTCPAITFSVAEGAEVDLATTDMIHITVALPEGMDSATDLFVEANILDKVGKQVNSFYFFTDFEDGYDLYTRSFNAGESYTINITKVAYGEVIGVDMETYMPIYEYEFVAEEGSALAALHFTTKATSTGIKNVSAAKTLNAKFIENGKLVIISNGKKFNAAGVEMK